MISSSTTNLREPKRLHGIPGVIYVLNNSGLKAGLVQVGLSRRSGWSKALELNRDKNNSIPGDFQCLFELRAQDGGAAIEEIFKQLHPFRCGKRDQDFFEIPQAQLEHIITTQVQRTDHQLQERFKQESAMRDYLSEHAATLSQTAINKNAPEAIVREGIFKKAINWMNDV